MVAQAPLRDKNKSLPGAAFQGKELSDPGKDKLGFQSRGASRTPSLGKPAFCWNLNLLKGTGYFHLIAKVLEVEGSGMKIQSP